MAYRQTEIASPLPTQPIYRILMVTGIYPTTARPHSGTFIKPIVDSLRVEGHIVDIIHPGAGWAPLRYLRAACQVFIRTLHTHYDIVHGHYGLWCLAARCQWRSAVVSAFLGDDLLGTISASGRYTRKSLLVVGLSRWLCRVSHATTVKSEQMKKAARWPEAVVIADGIDFTLFRPIPRQLARASLGWSQQGLFILFANNPALPVKNIALAREAVCLLKMRGIAAELVTVSGLPQSKLVEYINASNVLLLSSLAEGTPNVVKEAQACNIPVVATDVGDVAQVIGRTDGCSVCTQDAESLAKGLEKALRHSKPTTGRADIAHLESSIVLQDILKLYAQAIAVKMKMPI